MLHSQSTLKKKHNAICSHRVRGCVAVGSMIIHKVDFEFNLSDMLATCLAAESRKRLCEQIMLEEV